MPQLPIRSLVRRLDFTSLQLFVAVCETGSIGQAAERESMAASAISKRLADLEDALGTRLLERHARGVQLTTAGESLLRHARSALFMVERMHGEIAEHARGARGHVRVHANISAIVQFLPEDLGTFVRAHPEVKVELEELPSTRVFRTVSDGLADVGICNIEVLGAGHGLQVKPYRVDRLVLVVPAAHALATREAVAFAETLDFDHVGLPSTSSIFIATREAAALQGRRVPLRIQVAGLDAMCRMIDNGLGVGVMPRRAFDLVRGVGALVAVPLADRWAERRIDLVARDFDALSGVAALLVDHLCNPAASPRQ